ncbi:MAG: Re/Si-specific NAD(P)(+) transhydrogenase subunit alpha [Gammaproteobacteria bacterium]|nr:Re/Si-specific NAD(P)(+) transhydrogenase subunit alpha [Gammaproteobacteria bacterium]
MKIVIPAEIHRGEKRLATSPEVVGKLVAAGFKVVVESGAGKGASIGDDVFREMGAKIARDAESAWAAGDLILKVRPPQYNKELGRHEIDLMQKGAHLISFIWPAQNEELLQKLAKRKVTVQAMDSIPRISRAQKLDALSSMANIAGYRAVIEASHQFNRFLSGQITAAGKVDPARVLVIGAGVAGLAAIGTAKSLGAIVRAFDTRPEVKGQILSMDAEFLELEFEEDGTGQGGYAKVMSKEFIAAEMELFAQQAREVDIIITTALIPGKPAPKLITRKMVESMRDGSVIIDLASEQGGNCEATVPDKVVNKHGVYIVGYTDLPSRLAAQSSQLYATNIYNLIMEMCPQRDGKITVDMEDEVIRGATVVNCGEITWPPPPIAVGAERKPSFGGQAIKTAQDEVDAPQAPVAGETSEISRFCKSVWFPLILGGLALFGLGQVAPPSFMTHFTVFILSCFIGYMVIWSVSPTLHTPLMSVTNAISSIIILGALTQISSGNSLIYILAGIAVFITCINIVGGFSVTQRMLQMFRG